jgi:hypothetical protein
VAHFREARPLDRASSLHRRQEEKQAFVTQGEAVDWTLQMERKRAMLRGQREPTAFGSLEVQLDAIHGEMKMLRKDVQSLEAALRALHLALPKSWT